MSDTVEEFEKLEDFIDEVAPTLQGAVRFLWAVGYITTDSGDGTNFENGMECALPYDHIFIELTRPETLVDHCGYLRSLMDNHNCPDIDVEGSYNPTSGISIIGLYDHEGTGQLRLLR